MKSEDTLSEIYERNLKTVWNICYPFFMNKADTEDAVQDTFVRLALSDKTFRDAEHEKAWLIVTARNICKDELRRAGRKDAPIEAAETVAKPEEPSGDLLSALHKLPEQYRTAIYLFYYEGYGSAQIAGMLRKSDSAVRSDLRRGRNMLKKLLGGEYFEE